MKKGLLVTLGLAGACLFTLAGRAQPNATYSLNTLTGENDEVTITDPVSGTVLPGSPPLNVSSEISHIYSGTGIGDTANSNIMGGTDPTLTATATNLGLDSTANATLDYYFKVNSTGSANVPINIAGTYTDTNGGGYSVASEVIISPTTYNQGLFAFSANTAGGGAGYTSTLTNSALQSGLNVNGPLTGNDVIHWATTIYVVPNQVFELELFVHAASNAGGTATVVLDPTTVIDPTFLAANPGDSISFSPGLSAVPEPSTYALIFGAAALGFAAFRRKRAAT